MLSPLFSLFWGFFNQDRLQEDWQMASLAGQDSSAHLPLPAASVGLQTIGCRYLLAGKSRKKPAGSGNEWQAD